MYTVQYVQGVAEKLTPSDNRSEFILTQQMSGVGAK